MFQILPVIAWILILEILGLIAFPIIFSFFGKLKDKGYGFSKTVGMLLVTYLAWLMGNFGIKYSRFSSILSLTLISGISIWIFFRKKQEIFEFFRENFRTILVIETVFLLSFLTFTVVRYFDNSIVDAEKPQDFMMLNGLLREEKFPLNDPWFTGEPIQYYYFGHLMVATMTKITGISSGIAYNLTIPLFFSLTLITSFSVLYNLTKKIKYGLIGSVFVGIVGNLRGLLQVLETRSFLPLNYWLSAHYIIPGTINEFPFFAFLHADMHAHMMAIPFTIICIGVGYSLIKKKSKLGLTEIGLVSLFVGSLSFLNTWDYPTYLSLILGVLVVREYIKSRKIDYEWIKNVAIPSLSVIILSFLLFLPFHLTVNSMKKVAFTSQKTGTVHYLIIYGLFFFVSFTYLYFEAKKNKVTSIHLPFFKISIPIDFLILLFLVFGALNIPVVILVLVGLISGILVWKKSNSKRVDTENLFSLILFTIGVGLLIAIEFFYVDDAFTGDLERVNTVFKIGMQTWILISISSVYFLKRVVEKYFNGWKKFWILGLILLILSSLIYPIFATITKTRNNYNFFHKHSTLDGREYLKTQDFCDYDAVKWINENINGQPVILEAKGQSFTWTSCVSFNTGLPTVIGWEGHEQQWRPDNLDGIEERVEDVNEIYTNHTQELIEKYNISYIYVGKLERDKYGAEDLNELEDLFELVYSNDEAKIYKVD